MCLHASVCVQQRGLVLCGAPYDFSPVTDHVVLALSLIMWWKSGMVMVPCSWPINQTTEPHTPYKINHAAMLDDPFTCTNQVKSS